MKPVAFGYKNAWFACRCEHPGDVVAALGLREPVSTDWGRGIDAAYGDGRAGSGAGTVFVTPPIDGWVLAVGRTLLDLCGGDPPPIRAWCERLSAALATEVQFFATYRVVDAHGWAKAIDGRCVRAYMIVEGATSEDYGGPSADERALGFRLFDSRSAAVDVPGHWERTDLEHPSEQHVMALAAVWSIDPSELETREIDVAAGIAGGIIIVPGDAVPARARHVDTHTQPPVRTKRSWWRFW